MVEDVAVILAGGEGTRLRPYTEDKPKPMVEVYGLPILEWIIRWLRTYEIKRFIILCGYKYQSIIDYFKDGRRLGVSISYVVESEPLGTGGALKNALPFLPEKFFVVYGDIITNLDPLKLIGFVENGRYDIVIASVKLRSRYGIFKLEGSRVIDFYEKPVIDDLWINAGVMYMRYEAVYNFLIKENMENRFSKLAREGRIGIVRYDNVYWRSIETAKDLEEIENDNEFTAQIVYRYRGW